MPTVLPGTHPGLVQEGNLDLERRPVVHNPDGSVSTVRSMSFGTSQGEVLVPTIDETGQLSPRQAMDRYARTGEHLGIFDTPENATSYAQALHSQQEARYGPLLPPPVPRPAMAGGLAEEPSGGAGGDDLASAYAVQVNDREKMAAVEQLAGWRAATRPLPQRPPVTGPGELAVRAAEDVGRGIFQEAAPAMATGARDAVQEMIDLANSTDDVLRGMGIGGKGKIPSLPEMKIFRPETETGAAIQKITQFLTGWMVAGKQLKALGGAIGVGEKLAKPASALGKVASGAARGALTGAEAFDPQEQKLGDLLTGLGLPENALTEYLSTDPHDEEATGRFKNALSNVVAGAAFDGLAMVARTLRAARAARAAPGSAQPVPGLPPDTPIITQRDLINLGDPTKPAISKVPVNSPLQMALGAMSPTELGVPESVAARGVAGAGAEAGPSITARAGRAEPPLPRQQGGDRLYFNFSRINSPDDVAAVLDDATQAFKPDIDAARRGVRTWQQTSLSADQLNAFDELVKNRGMPLNAEQTVAARELWVTSANQLLQLAKTAVQSPTDANLFAFRKMLATHYAIQTQVAAARTETARALNAWAIPVGSDAMRATEIQNVLNSWGGSDLAFDMARKVAGLGNNAQALDRFTLGNAFERSKEHALRIWINWGLLSNPKTWIVNGTSNLAVATQQLYETGVARQIARVIGDEQGVQAGEAMAQLYGMIQGGGKEGLQQAWEVLKSGQGTELATMSIGKTEAVGSASAAQAMAQAGVTGRWTDVLLALEGAPGRVMQATDAYFQTMGYRMALQQQAVRMAGQEVAAGKIPAVQLKSRIADILTNPPDELQVLAVNQAKYQTFNNAPVQLTQTLMRARAQYPALNLLIPFLRTPSNILTYSVERSPLAPLLRGWRADIAAGGARREIALARMASGTMLMQTFYDLALSGVVTGRGPQNPQTVATMKRAGWQPYSVRVPMPDGSFRYFAYNRFDPIGTSIGEAADLVEILHNTDWDPNDSKPQETLADAIVLSIANNAMNKTYLSGVATFIRALADPERTGMSYFERLASSVVPGGIREFARERDPWQREVDGMLDSARAGTPGLTSGLPLRRDLWGRPIGYESGLGWAYDMFSPIYSRRENPEAIDREILMNHWLIPDTPRSQSFNGVDINLAKYPQVWSHFKYLQGQGVRDEFHMNLLDTLNGYINGRHPMAADYHSRTDGSSGGKEAMVRDTISKFAGLARNRLLTEPIDRLPAALQAEEQAFRAEYRDKYVAQPQTYKGMPPRSFVPPTPGVLP